LSVKPSSIAAIAAAAFFIVLAAVPLFWGIQRGLFAGMSLHGWVALGLGCVVSAIVGVGLMMLVFHSARSGHDDTIGDGS
jgi:hypothetical protein